MTQRPLKIARAVCVGSLAAIAFAAALAAHAQTAAPAAPAARAAPAPAMPAMPKTDMAKGMMGSDGMKQSMMMGMDSMQKMPMTGDTDKDFAMMMKMHHQQGVEMAEMELKNGKSPAMKKMATQIISAQKKEITAFDKWLATAK